MRLLHVPATWWRHSASCRTSNPADRLSWLPSIPAKSEASLIGPAPIRSKRWSSLRSVPQWQRRAASSNGRPAESGGRSSSGSDSARIHSLNNSAICNQINKNQLTCHQSHSRHTITPVTHFISSGTNRRISRVTRVSGINGSVVACPPLIKGQPPRTANRRQRHKQFHPQLISPSSRRAPVHQNFESSVSRKPDR